MANEPNRSPKRKRGRPRSPAGPKDQLIFVRAPKELLQRLDAHLGRFQSRNPQFKVHRSDLVRSLVERALAIEENEAQSEVGKSAPPFASEPGEFTLPVAARVVLEAVRAATSEVDLTDLTVPLAKVYGRCRGIARRDYDEGLRTLERFGFLSLRRALDPRSLSTQERAAALIDPRGTLVEAELSPSIVRADAPRSTPQPREKQDSPDPD